MSFFSQTYCIELNKEILPTSTKTNLLIHENKKNKKNKVDLKTT
jgi:hypothetical protein